MVNTLRYVVIYDVSDDNLRNQVSETLKDYGLQRIQYSGFMGDLRRDQLNSLLVDLKNILVDLVENVQLFPMCDSCLKGKKMVGKPKKYTFKEKKDNIMYF
jgi:CRISPR-associated protein Cas2